MDRTTTINLPGGLWLDDTCHQQADLRSLTGEDEDFLLTAGETLMPVRRTTLLLARCMTRLGSLNQVTAETTALLTVGDREALLLHMRRMTLGDHLQCILTCPNADCGEKMDLDLNVSDLLVPPYAHIQQWYERKLDGDGASYHVRFRLPTGAIQEEAANVARRNLNEAAELLVRRCVESVRAEDGQPVLSIPPFIIDQLSTVIAESDPQAELRLNADCSFCGHAFSVLFDASTYFFHEMSRRVKHLYKEAHLLAFYYHWSEAEIMSLTTRKRRLYVELLSEALTQKIR